MNQPRYLPQYTVRPSLIPVQPFVPIYSLPITVDDPLVLVMGDAKINQTEKLCFVPTLWKRERERGGKQTNKQKHVHTPTPYNLNRFAYVYIYD